MTPCDPVDRLVGIGPKLRASLAEAGVTRVLDLLLNVPRRYEDRTSATPLGAGLQPGRLVLVRGRVGAVGAKRTARRRRASLVSAILEDGRGVLPMVFFNQPWVAARLNRAREITAFGLLRRSPSGALQLVNPEIEEVDPDDVVERIVPVYPSVGRLAGRPLRRVTEQALEVVERCPDPVGEELCSELGLPGLVESLRGLHAPPVPDDASARKRLVEELNERRSPWHRRLAFDELLALACDLAARRGRRAGQRAPRCAGARGVDERARTVLPFALTGAQRRVVGEIAAELEGPVPMGRLLQGDVGSGKTVVAALAMLAAAQGGHQAALMAPTELLAEQHAATLSGLLGGSVGRIELLTSSVPPAEQRRIRTDLEQGTTRLVVGTHALIQASVRFRDLGLVVIDEQHRFGVVHREALLGKGRAPHSLVMTATPIPRSLALTVYGDLDLSLLDELPPGRRPVRTVVRHPSSKPRLYDFLRREVAQGGRAYFVYPMIEASEELPAPALEASRAEVAAALPGVGVGVLHGRMNRGEREEVYRSFAAGTVQVLLATTVVEVGIDVPEATVVVVEGAERFGLSQLHQLRGRVGRGRRPSYCVLLVQEDLSEEAHRRLEVICSSDDGFAIAEADLALRGPGELAGTHQWGPTDLRFADLSEHRDLIEPARRLARRLLAEGRLEPLREDLARYHRDPMAVPSG